MSCLCPKDEPHSCSSQKYAWFESRVERDSQPDLEVSDLIVNMGASVPKKFAKNFMAKMSGDQMEEAIDQMSDYFLDMIRKDSPQIDYNVLETRLKIKYMNDGHSAMILNGRNGINIIVDHDMPNPWSEINCKTETKLFEKCGMKISDFRIKDKVYSYVIEPQEEFYKKLAKKPDSFWNEISKPSRTISQDILGQIEKTAITLGFTLENILELMAQNEFITRQRYESK